MVVHIVFHPMRFAELFDGEMRQKQALQIAFGLQQVLRGQPIIFRGFFPVENMVVLGHEA